MSDGAPAQQARALVESWTQAGILEPSLWVTPNGVVDVSHGPPTVMATHVHAAGSNQVSLFDHVGRFRLDVVRVVAAHLIVQDGVIDKQLDAAATKVASAISAALPRRSDGSQTAGTRLHRSLVLIPLSGAAGASLEATKPDWEVNVVISPEDRPDLDRANVYVRHPGNFEGHSANALAAVGGILRGVDVGVLDGISSDSTTADGDVIVARISVRAIVGDDMLDDVAARVLDLTELDPVGPASMLPWARPATHATELASEAAAHLLRQPEWSPTERPPLSSTRKGHQSLLTALKTAAVFNLRTSGAVLSWMLSAGRAGVERGATEAIVGAKAGTLVTLGPRPVEDLTRASERLLQRERSQLNETIQSTRIAVPAATTWGELRSLSFALADGGDLGEFPEPRQAGKRELVPAAAVAVHPDESWPEPLLHANDPVPMRQHLRELEGVVSVAKAGVTAAEAALRHAQLAREERPPEADSGDDEYWPDDATLDSLSEELTSAQMELATAERDLEDFLQWYKPQSASMLWQVGDDVGRRIAELDRAQREIEERDGKRTPPAEALRKAQRALRRWWIWTAAPWFVMAATCAYLFFGPLPERWEILRPETDSFIITEAVLFLLAVVLLTAANHRFYKAVRTYEWQVEGLVDSIRNDRALKVYAGQERARLEFLYDTLRDWTHIIGEVLHRPWAPVSRGYKELPSEVIDALPASTGFARQTDDDDDVSTTILMQAYDTTYPRGWASRHFEAAYTAWEEEQPSGSSDGYRPTDVDTLLNPASPRRRLLEFWRVGSARTAITARARKGLRDAVQSGSLSLPTRRVKRLGRFGDNETYTERDFFAAMATESTAFTLDLFTSSAQLARRHYIERSIAWLPGAARTLAPHEDVEVYKSDGSIAVRVDISKRISAPELEPFASSILVRVSDAVVTPARAPSDAVGEDSPWV